MKDGFEGRFSAVLLKSMQDNGINPHGMEMNRIVASCAPFFEAEFGEPKPVKVEAPKEKIAPAANAPVVKTWAERSTELSKSKGR
jgi:hypothetical protein